MTPMQIYIARQPIFDGTLTVQAYELLIREGLEKILPSREMDIESTRVLAASQLLPRLDAVAAGKQAFVSATREVLVQGYLEILPAETTVVQLPETIKPDREVLETCGQLRRAGFRIALENFRLGSDRQPLLAVTDLLKVNIAETGVTERTVIAERARTRKISLVADKVETKDIYKETRALGYDLFQGNFFARPSIVAGRDIPTSKRGCLQILGQLHRSDLDIPALNDIISREVALAYKLLRYVNSAAFGWHGSVSSIQHALMLLGSREIRRWASVMALTGITGDEPGELLAEALLRGRTCELLASEADMNQRVADLFLMGLFSLLDVILELPLEEILENLPLERDLKGALLGEPGPLRNIYDLAVTYLAGEWGSIPDQAQRLGISEMVLPDLYESALSWSSEGRRFAALAAA
jgi:c-di-GMP-related signal transduction protein